VDGIHRHRDYKFDVHHQYGGKSFGISLIKQGTKLDITWGMWFLGFLPMAIVLLIFAPLLVYIIYPPELKTSKEVPIWARGELNKMGAMTLQEIVMAAIVCHPRLRMDPPTDGK